MKKKIFTAVALGLLTQATLTLNAQVTVGAGGAGAVGANSTTTNSNVGIGNSVPTAPLSFNNISSKKISFWSPSVSSATSTDYYGMAVEPFTLVYTTDQVGSDHSFRAATSSSTFNELMRIKGNGLVNITDRLNVGNSITLGNTTTSTAGLTFPPTTALKKIALHDVSGNTTSHLFYGFGIDANVLRYQVGHTGASHVFYAGAGAGTSNELLRITGNGRLGIGTTTPAAAIHVAGATNKVIIGDAGTLIPGTYRLYVQGGILTEKLKCAVRNTTNWADFVFDPSYKLMPLVEVEKYIVANRHLPEVPSAVELVQDGLDVAEMQAKQMQKIEELTMYIIDLQKQIDALKTNK
jgi:hypothetical protein